MLRDSNTVVPVPKLAEYIRDCEHDNPQSKDVLSIRLSLHHNHLPKLDEAAVVKYDQREEAVRPGQNFETLMDLLEKVGEEDLPHPDD